MFLLKKKLILIYLLIFLFVNCKNIYTGVYIDPGHNTPHNWMVYVTANGSPIYRQRAVFDADTEYVDFVVKAKYGQLKVNIDDSVTNDCTDTAEKRIELVDDITTVTVFSLYGATVIRNTFYIYRKPLNLNLKYLSVKVNNNLIPFEFNSNSSNATMVVPELKNGKLLDIRAVTALKDGKVKIDDGEFFLNEAFQSYDVLPSSITIKVNVENHEKIYTLNFVTALQKTQVVVNVISAVGQSIVEGSTVSVYPHGYSDSLKNAKTDSSGNVQFNLDAGKYYDFIASKNGMSGSRLENVFIKGSESQNLVIVQRYGSVGEKHEPPAIMSVRLGNFNTDLPYSGLNKAEELQYGQLITSMDRENEGLFIQFHCPSRIIESSGSVNGNFGVACNVGSPPSESSYSAIGFVYAVDFDTCMAFIPLNGIRFVNGSNILYIVAYDVAGNRVERQIYLNFQDIENLNDITGAFIDNFNVSMQRLPMALHLFSVGHHEGMATSYQTVFEFTVKDIHGLDININGYHIYRRKYEANTEVDKNWQRVVTKYYNGGSNVELAPAYTPNRIHIGYDRDHLLQENVEYEYKIVAFSDSFHTIESPIARSKLFEPFYIKLITPAKNEQIDYSDLDNIEFSFQISNKSLWDSNITDYFQFGLLIVEKSNNANVVFYNKFRYRFTAKNDDRLEIAEYNMSSSDYDYTSFAKRRGYFDVLDTITVDDLIRYDENTGIVTICSEILKNKKFNLKEKSLSALLEKGVTYFWDIQDWGKNEVFWGDDSSACFVKEWKMLDPNTGIPLKEDFQKKPYPKSKAVSSSNIQGSDNAINGRLEFSVGEN